MFAKTAVLASVSQTFPASLPLCAHNLEGGTENNQILINYDKHHEGNIYAAREHRMGRLTWSSPEHSGSRKNLRGGQTAYGEWLQSL